MGLGYASGDGANANKVGYHAGVKREQHCEPDDNMTVTRAAYDVCGTVPRPYDIRYTYPNGLFYFISGNARVRYNRPRSLPKGVIDRGAHGYMGGVLCVRHARGGVRICAAAGQHVGFYGGMLIGIGGILA